jgi:flagellin-like protein
MMKKGITPIVAIIMLLLIVISLVGGMFVWMRRTMGGLQESAGNQTLEKAQTMGQTVAIESCSCSDNEVYASAGSVAVDSATLYVNGSMCESNPISADAVTTFSAGSGCPSLQDGLSVRIVVAGAPGNYDEATACEC